MGDHEELTVNEIPGRLVVFMIARTCENLDATSEVEIKAQRSAPSYPAVIPKQKIIRLEQRAVDGREVDFLVKSYLPDMVIVEASIETDDILAEGTLEFKRRLLGECRSILAEYNCDRAFDEEYEPWYRSSPAEVSIILTSIRFVKIEFFMLKSMSRSTDQPQ